MNNAIKYYYNLDALEIHQYNGNYRFTSKNNKYALVKIEEANLNEIYSLNMYLINNKMPCHKIILNNNNEISTIINDNTYVLMQIYVDINEEVILNDINYFSKYVINYETKLKRENWQELWMRKVDYLEYQINQVGKKYPILMSSFSYFVGMAETAIELLNEIKKMASNYVVSHKQILKKYTLFDLYNPLNFIIDLKIRDTAEFFKKKFFSGEDISYEVNYYLNYNNLSTYELNMFFVRMIYPSFYFDVYENVVNDEIDEKEIIKIINRVDDYEEFLRNLYFSIGSIIELPNIEWIKKS